MTIYNSSRFKCDGLMENFLLESKNGKEDRKAFLSAKEMGKEHFCCYNLSVCITGSCLPCFSLKVLNLAYFTMRWNSEASLCVKGIAWRPSIQCLKNQLLKSKMRKTLLAHVEETVKF